MKLRTLLLCLLLVLLKLHAFGAKAISTPIYFNQPDGSQLCYYINGDENFNWKTTCDGVLLIEKNNAFYIADIDSEGNATASNILAHHRSMRSPAEFAAVNAQSISIFFNKAQTTMQDKAITRQPIANITPAYVQHNGRPRILVILAQYSDTLCYYKNEKDSFNTIFNGATDNKMFIKQSHNIFSNYGSVKTYFNDMSFGAYQPQFTVIGPVTLSKGMKYYDSDALASEALELATDSVNMTIFKTDADGNEQTPMVYIIFAGYSKNEGGTGIWACTSTFTSGKTVGGTTFRRYSCSSELSGSSTINWKKNGYLPPLTGIGVICHEFSHSMGLPDMYPSNTSAYLNNQEMEYWDLMDGGEYVYNNGYCPAPYTAWEREAMGWMKIDTLKEDTKIENLKSIEGTGGKAYRILNNSDANEYMILQNMQRINWGQGLYNTFGAHGLIMYHVAYASSTVDVNDYPNNTPEKPRMAIVPADSLVISSYLSGDGKNYTNKQYFKSHAGDTFPGTSYVTEINPAHTTTNFKWYTGSSINIALKGITEDTNNKSISFDYIQDYKTGIKAIDYNYNATTDIRIYTIGGQYVGTNTNNLPKGIYIRNHKKFIIK